MLRYATLATSWMLGLSLVAYGPAGAEARDDCGFIIGELASVEGEVDVRALDAPAWQPSMIGAPLCEGDSVRVGGNARAAISLINGAVLRLDANTTMKLVDIVRDERSRSVLDIVAGAFQSFSRRPTTLAVNTPYLNATIDGTEYVVRVTDDQTRLTVIEGVVNVSNDQGSLEVTPGTAAVAQAGAAPVSELVVNPTDAVQWGLFYPPVLAADADPEIARAADLVSVGRIDEAVVILRDVLAANPANADAQALLSVVQTVQNERETALELAEAAIANDPTGLAPKIAMSYARQAAFDLNGARAIMEAAVTEHPDSALAWARLAELRLGTDDRAGSRDAANRAAALDPQLGQTRKVQGFAELASFRTGPAKEAFEAAIALNPADPLPHLGLGLARINEGDLDAGTRELDVAVALDSNNSLLRSYLGKAYFEQKRSPLDAQQFEIAKALDPNDPTPWLYDAIRLQTENRPIEALEALDTSIALNDNRAVFRSGLALDSDRAARGASLGRIFDDLGFTDLGMRAATNSITDDPSNAAAHRFLSDVYRGTRRREIARVSELLQAQLLQDVNINPVQPSMSETNLNIVTSGGPAEAGLNEFTPLFDRNQVQANFTALAGTDETLGGEGVVTARHGPLSLSAGAFGYTTDGWRDNGDIEHQIYNLFAQAAVTEDLNLQFEIRHRETDNGDLAFNFDPDDFLEDFDRDLEETSARIGARYSPAPHSDLLLSLIYTDRDLKTDQTQPFFPPASVTSQSEFPQESIQGEAQYIFRADRFNIITGGAYADVDRETKNTSTFNGLPFPPINDKFDSQIEHARGYVYGNFNAPQPVTWTLGLSADDYDESPIEVQKINPKLGVQWDITSTTRLRAAGFRTVKPALANNRTIEPTQIAGFNQFFDDSNGTESIRYGIGAEQDITNRLTIGAEATFRQITQPILLDGNDRYEEADEQTHRAYAYFAATKRLSFGLEFQFDYWNADEDILTENGTWPEEITTYSVPLTARYFHPNGLFAQLTGTFVYQDVERDAAFDNQGDDDFVTVDAAIGYRFPNRAGQISLQGTNLFDTGFNYQDDSFREFGDDPSIGPYIPERRIMLTATLNF